jgi:hypothetical protein
VKSILDPTFKYTPACSTDIRKTFKRIRQQQAKPWRPKEWPPTYEVIHLEVDEIQAAPIFQPLKRVK